MTMSIEDGRLAVRIAREAVEACTSGESPPAVSTSSPLFAENRGVFVTLNSLNGSHKDLRGCVGFPYPVKPLSQAIPDAASAAASEDPRFPPLQASELGSVSVEVSVLTLPKALNPQRRDQLPSLIVIGRDGLIVSRASFSGLLLPQVAIEHNMDSTEFLHQACMKAGLYPDSWLEDGTVVQVFQAEIFEETSPRGDVSRVLPGGH